MSVVPYSFEPTKKSKKQKPTELEDDGWETVSDEGDDEINAISDDCVEKTLENLSRVSIKSIDWCKCGECDIMPVNRECLCCTEVDKIKIDKLDPDLRCITNHEAFQPLCLNKYVLYNTLTSLHDCECAWLPPEDNVPSRSYRHVVYHQFTWFIYSKLGRYVRRIVPACVVAKIRKTFPSDDGFYVNFEGDDEGADGISEVVLAWEYLS